MRSFSSYREAANHACAVAREVGAAVRVLRDGDVWVVHSPSSPSPPAQPTLVPHPPTLVMPVAAQGTRCRAKLTPEAEWEHLWSIASKAARGVGATRHDVLDEFSRLLKKGNPLALQAQKELIESEKDNAYRKTSPGFLQGEVLFRPFSEELPFLRG